MGDKYHVIPKIYACLLHVIIVLSMIFAFDRTKAITPELPLTVQATLYDSAIEEMVPRESRAEAEERKRIEDQREEVKRIKKLEADESMRQKKENEARLKREKEEKLKQEAELERKRIKAEEKRLEDIKKQRLENERLKKQIEEEERKKQLEDELAIEQGRLDAAISGALIRYQFALMQKIESNWIQPPSAGKGTKCVVSVTQLPGGEVISANVKSCNGDENLRRSVEAAIYKASPLPKPEDPNLYERNLRFIFEPAQ